jgi:hypothetical protein
MTTSNSKKRGRPLGSKNKVKKISRPIGSKNKKPRAGKVEAFKQFEPSQRALAKIVELEKIRQNLHNLIDNLEHQAVQYRAVISYLENKLENK